MKKNIAISIALITLLSCIYFFRVTNNKKEILSGNKINEYLYAYDLLKENETWNNFIIKEDDIYYLVSTEKESNITHKLYKRNIYEEKSILLKEFTKESTYCNLKNNYIECNNDTEVIIYNYDLLELYKTNTLDSEAYPLIIPYKDTFLKCRDNTLYLNQKKEEKEFQKLPNELNETYIESYYIEKDNTYLLLFNLNKNQFYIYDINKKTYEKIDSEYSKTYKSGFYFYNKNNYEIHNLKENKKINYENLLQNEYEYSSFLENDKEIYYFDSIKKELKIINLETNKLKKINLEITIENPINRIEKVNNYLFLELAQEKNNFYLIDLTKIKETEINIIEEKEKEEQEIKKIISNIKTNKNVKIKIKEETNIEYPDFSAKVETDNGKIISALKKIESILEKYSKEVFDDFYLKEMLGLNIYLTGNLTPNDTQTQIENPAGYSLMYNSEYCIVIDINQPNIEELLCHELMHNLEYVLDKKEIKAFSEWDTYNPNEFQYNNSYTAPYLYNYTITEKEKENVYFIDTYSHTYKEEDRARIMESICSCNENSEIKKYPNLLKKGTYLQEELYKYYPSLKESTLFNSIKN